ncbi:MAG: hypothetical protein GY926_19545 [bacterium]|nr:hypothetical protein [bacterium]
MAETPENERDINIAAEFLALVQKDARRKTLEEARDSACRFCREGWPDSSPSGDHAFPSGAGWKQCMAASIRELLTELDMEENEKCQKTNTY